MIMASFLYDLQTSLKQKAPPSIRSGVIILPSTPLLGVDSKKKHMLKKNSYLDFPDKSSDFLEFHLLPLKIS